ncbi:hypothetical protein Tco_1118885, partial [Tanacetum coccineum]
TTYRSTSRYSNGMSNGSKDGRLTNGRLHFIKFETSKISLDFISSKQHHYRGSFAVIVDCKRCHFQNFFCYFNLKETTGIYLLPFLHFVITTSPWTTTHLTGISTLCRSIPWRLLLTHLSRPIKKRVQELTEEGNVLRYELNDMKGKYTSARSSYTHVAEALEKSRQQETSMGNMVLLFSDENERMKQELMWVMREAIPRMLMRVLRSEEFDLEMMKVRDVIIEQGRELGSCGAEERDMGVYGHDNQGAGLSYALLRYVL